MRLLLASLLVLGALLAAAVPAVAAPPALSVQRGADPAIVDAHGREVLLRGLNFNQLGDYYAADPALPTVEPLVEEDFARIAGLGFNVVRLVMNWSAFQPARGAFDAGYVARVRQAVRWAARHDLYVVLDMHQDSWGKHIATPRGASCPPGLDPAVGWDGAPEWATFTDGLTTCRANDSRELSPAVAQAFQSFYADREGIQTELVQTWGRIAGALGGEPNVAGYDLLNEPHPGFLVGPDQGVLLGRFYARAITAIRDGERAAGAPRRVVFFEPSVTWSGVSADALPPPGFTDDPELVFAPHLYAESIAIDRGATSIEQGFDRAERAAALYGAPLWSGEWGWFGPPERDGPRVARYVAQEDARALGGAWWVWKQACGDPHVAGYPGASGSLNPRECPGGRQLPLVTGYTDVLRRAYPRHAPGRLGTLRSDAAAGTFVFRGTAPAGRTGAACRLEAWVPDTGRGEPRLQAQGLSGLAVRAAPGGFVVTACTRGGAWELRGAPGGRDAGGAGPGPGRGARACRSRRVVTITLPRRARRAGVRGVVVRVAGRRAWRVRAPRGRVRVDLTGRPRGRVVVTVEARLRGGRRFTERRAYRLCARRR
jgi:endoglycosylceramidase